MHDLIFPSGHDLVRQLRIRDKGSGHFYNIGFSGSNDFFHHFRIIQGTDRRHRDRYVLLDLGGIMHIDASGLETVGLPSLIRLFTVYAGRYMQKVDPVLHQLRQFNRISDFITARDVFVRADAQLDREAGPNGFADGVQDFQHKSSPVFKRAAVLVPPVVHGRRKELMQKPAMASMDKEHAEAGAL